MGIELIWNAPDGLGGFVARRVVGRVEARISAKALRRAKAWRRRLAAGREEDAAWDWAQLLAEFEVSRAVGLGEWIPYSLWALNDLQGLMVVDAGGKRFPTRRRGLPQVYVEHLGVAPDNRARLRTPRRIVGCGLALLGVARALSERRGWRGRLGLHSLPGAVGFYRATGFRDHGPDPAEDGFHYMEHSGTVKA